MTHNVPDPRVNYLDFGISPADRETTFREWHAALGKRASLIEDSKDTEIARLRSENDTLRTQVKDLQRLNESLQIRLRAVLACEASE